MPSFAEIERAVAAIDYLRPQLPDRDDLHGDSLAAKLVLSAILSSRSHTARMVQGDNAQATLSDRQRIALTARLSGVLRRMEGVALTDLPQAQEHLTYLADMLDRLNRQKTDGLGITCGIPSF